MVNNLVRSLISRYRAKLALQIEIVPKDSLLWAFEVSANADMTESANQIKQTDKTAAL